MQSEWKTHKDAPPECPDAAKTLMRSQTRTPPTLEKPMANRKSGAVAEHCRSHAATSAAAARSAPGDSTGAGSRRKRLWRVLKAALPVQVALVLLYCVACLLEPHCCDLLNNFHTSFGPQLRYTHGPPPV